MKVFFVDMDDELRERVTWGIADIVRTNVEAEEESIISDFNSYPIKRFDVRTKYTVEIVFKEQEDGTVFRVENFKEEMDEYSCDRIL